MITYQKRESFHWIQGEEKSVCMQICSGALCLYISVISTVGCINVIIKKDFHRVGLFSYTINN